ncbi:MAG: S-layer homology domain-containing protein, partial [Muribaculaceae bacterium]|nr:S-layer homology domain-containing protein [Muribaculaceae bacterium]
MYKRILSLTLIIVLTLALAVPAAGAGCPCNIEYRLGAKGVSADKTTDSIPSDTKPAASKIPGVQGLGNWAFVGWSTTDPEKAEPTMVNPADTRITKDTVYYAVYEPLHKHYVIGYPSGEFGPNDFITRGSVAT